MQEVFVREHLWEDLQHAKDTFVHIILIATKPDIIKQAPLYQELKRQNKLTLVIHTGQHYDYELSEGALEEFGIEVGMNLNIYGDLSFKFWLVIQRLGVIFSYFSEIGKIPVPYIHGDTMAAATGGIAAFLNKIGVVHVESGIRTHSLSSTFLQSLQEDFQKTQRIDAQWYLWEMQKKENFVTGSIEPFPEQFDTKSVSAGTGLCMVPNILYEDMLLANGYPAENIFTVWNTIADAVTLSQEKIQNMGYNILDRFPQFVGKKFIVVTLHRRENCENESRFRIIFWALAELIRQKIPICLLELSACKTAIEAYGFQEELDTLRKKYKESFYYGPPLAHHHEIIDLMSQSSLILTDSWSMVEEAAIVGTPCVSVRFGTDRIESVWNGCSLIAPPIDEKLITQIVKMALEEKMTEKRDLYGSNVSKQIVGHVDNFLKKYGKIFLFDDERLRTNGYIH